MRCSGEIFGAGGLPYSSRLVSNFFRGRGSRRIPAAASAARCRRTWGGARCFGFGDCPLSTVKSGTAGFFSYSRANSLKIFRISAWIFRSRAPYSSSEMFGIEGGRFSGDIIVSAISTGFFGIEPGSHQDNRHSPPIRGEDRHRVPIPDHGIGPGEVPDVLAVHQDVDKLPGLPFDATDGPDPAR